MLRLYNSLTRSVDEFKPMDPPKVGLYTCGPTVYNYLHVGNWRTYVFEDVFRRALVLLGFQVRHVMNITDVGHLTSDADSGEDKLEVGGAREGKTAWEVAKFYTEAFLSDSRALGLAPPDVLCRATDHIPEQIELCRRLEDRGFLYKTADGVYFDTARFDGYGRLAGVENLAGAKAGARVEADPNKRNPADFAVWKLSPPGKKRHMEWDSPWGRGFPGWHIECSAMAMKYLGESFDIHCGGVDHIPIHHTNEIAQAEGATGKPFARFWMHGEFLLMNAAKMAKSAGGFITLADLKARGIEPLDYRYHCLTAHYRKQLEFSWEALESSKTARRRLRETVAGLAKSASGPPIACAEWEARIKEALAGDLNVPEALAAVWDGLRADLPDSAKLAFLKTADSVLGMGLFEEGRPLPPELAGLVERRAKARAAKDFALSDSLRRELDAKGVLVEDGKDGQRWRWK